MLESLVAKNEVRQEFSLARVEGEIDTAQFHARRSGETFLDLAKKTAEKGDDKMTRAFLLADRGNVSTEVVRRTLFDAHTNAATNNIISLQDPPIDRSTLGPLKLITTPPEPSVEVKLKTAVRHLEVAQRLYGKGFKE